MTNLPELSFDSPAPTQTTVANQQALPELNINDANNQQPALPEISDDIWKVVDNTSSPPKDMSTFEAARRGVDQGVQDFNIAFTVNELVGEGLDKLGFPTWKKKVEAYKKGINDRYTEAAEANPVAAIGGRIVGGIGATAPTFAINATRQIAGKVVPKLVGRVIQGMGQSAAMGAAATEGNTLDNIRNYGAMGGVLNAIPGGAYATTALGAGAGAGYSALTGGDVTQGALIGGGVGLGGYTAARTIKGAAPTISKVSGQYTNTADDALQMSQQLKEKEGINLPLSLGDTKKGGLYKSFEYFVLDKLPFIGTASKNTKQVDAYEPAVKSLIQKVAGNAEGSAKSVAAVIDKEAVKAKKLANQAFDKVATLTEGFNKIGNKVDVQNLKSAANGLLKQTQQGLASNRRGNYTDDLLDITKRDNSLSFSDVRKLRSDVGAKIRELESSTTGKNDTVLGGYKSLFNQIEKSLDTWANYGANNKQITEAYNRAKSIYRGYSEIYKSKDMRRALVDDAAMFDFVKRASLDTNPVRVERFTKALGGEKGQAENRAYLLNKAFEDAYDKERRLLDPNTFLNQIDKTAATNGIRFGKTIDALKGYTNLLKHASHGFDATKNPMTGYIVGAALTTGTVAGGMYDPQTAAKVGIPLAVLGVIARNPQLFIHAGKISSKTDPSVVRALQNTATKRILNAGLTADFMQNDKSP